MHSQTFWFYPYIHHSVLRKWVLLNLWYNRFVGNWSNFYTNAKHLCLVFAVFDYVYHLRLCSCSDVVVFNI
jgi:hypothetical protein